MRSAIPRRHFSNNFPDLLGDGPGIFPIRPFSLYQPIIKSTYAEQSRKGPRHNLDLSRKKWETPRFSFSQDTRQPAILLMPPKSANISLLVRLSSRILGKRHQNLQVLRIETAQRSESAKPYHARRKSVSQVLFRRGMI